MASSSVQMKYVTLLAATAALGGFLFGFDSAVINGAVSGIQTSFTSSSAGTGFAVASILIGSAIGALVAGRFADHYGRRFVMIASAIIFALTAIWAGFSGGTMMFTVARFVSGIGVGAASVVCPAYIAEVSPAQLRGRLASLQQFGIVLGIFVALLSDALIADAAGGVTVLFHGVMAWRWMFLVEILPSILFGVAAIFVPESPRFLVAAKREDEALAILARIDSATTSAIIVEIQKTVNADRPPQLADLKGPNGKVLSIVWVGVVLSAFQQLVGINSIFYYGAVLWEAAGFTTSDSLRINVLTSIVNIVATIVAMAFVDKIGRRPLLLWGSAAMAVTLGILVAVFATASSANGHLVLPHATGIVALLAANLYVFAFGISWGPCVWVLLGEMFPNAIRGAAMAVAAFTLWVANWIVTVSFPPIVASLGPAGAYGLYFVFAVLSFGFVKRFVTETRGRVLEDM